MYWENDIYSTKSWEICSAHSEYLLEHGQIVSKICELRLKKKSENGQTLIELRNFKIMKAVHIF